MKKNTLSIVFVITACFGCAGNKSIGDANMPLKDVNSQPKASVPQNTTAVQNDANADGNHGHATQNVASGHATNDANEIDTILARLDQKSREIKTYEAKIVYLFKQPVLESETLREGMLYYINEEKGSKLRMNFTSQKQDNEPVPNSRQEYLFDGVNLTRVEYKTKNVEYRQLTDANKPLNAFDLASQYLPIVGFTKADKLRDDFEITPSASKEYYELLLTTKPKSRYKGDYAQIRFWIEKQSSLPVRMEATSPQDDISIIRLGEAKVNKDLPKDIFKIDVPADFSKNVIPFEKEKH